MARARGYIGFGSFGPEATRDLVFGPEAISLARPTEVLLLRQPMTARDAAVFLLHTAAEIEHALLIQYLYAAYSLGSPAQDTAAGRWQEAIVLIAKQEMAHLMTVQNLLRVLRGPLSFARENYPFDSEYYPFPFTLEPLSRDSLARYVAAESPDIQVGTPLFDSLPDPVKKYLSGAGPFKVNHVGLLYDKLIDIFRSKDDPNIAPPSGDPPEPGLHLDDGDFLTDVAGYQAKAVPWSSNILGSTIPNPPVTAAADPTEMRQACLAALQRIKDQGESGSDPQSHFEMFLAILRDAEFPDGAGPAPQVATNPNTSAPPRPGPPPPDPKAERERQDADAELAKGRITHTTTILWAQLFNARYRILLARIAHWLRLDDRPENGALRTFLQGAIAEMRDVLAPLAKWLTTLPRTDSAADGFAGAPFELPYDLSLPEREPDCWRLHQDLVQLSENLIDKLVAAGVPDAFLGTSLSALKARNSDDARTIAAAIAATSKATPSTRRRVGDIRELRILPPLAIARFGSSDTPLHNYVARINDDTGFRDLIPAPTLIVDRATGAITRVETPERMSFRDPDNPILIRPVAPFFEVWARFDDEPALRPLTTDDLADLGLTPGHVRWQVQVGNLKVFRRTRDPKDKIEAATGPFSVHAAQPLVGTCEHFKRDKSIPLGSVQYIRPSAQFPEIRLRFTPGRGKVYGPEPDSSVVDDVYDGDTGLWPKYADRDDDPTATIPGRIYAVRKDGRTSRGFLDDSCDGIIQVELKVGAKVLSAFARVSVGPPDFAPDSNPVRTVGDELEQVALGPEVPWPVPPAQVAEIVRRAVETIRLLNGEVMNGNQQVGKLPLHRSQSGRLANSNNMAGQTAGFGRAFEPIFPPEIVDTLRLWGFHRNILKGLIGPTLDPSAAQVVLDRLRPFDKVGDLTDAFRQKMPAMMRGSDGLLLALTRRQFNQVKAAAEAPTPTPVPTPAGAAEADMLRLINFFQTTQGAADFHTGVDIGGDRSLADLFDQPADLLNYLKTAKAVQSSSRAKKGKTLIVPGKPEESAFLQIIQLPGHPMKSRYAMTIPDTGKTGVQVVEAWIRSLA